MQSPEKPEPNSEAARHGTAQRNEYLHSKQWDDMVEQVKGVNKVKPSE